ncbi:MAG: hypothetical protein ACP5E5_07550 [Acidobacteriaceae bacterium]
MNANPETEGAQRLTTAEEEAVKQDIVDEIYGHPLQGYVADVGKQPWRSFYELNASFKPTLNRNKTGWVVYKRMPHGQVSRMFTLRRDRLAVL